MKISTFGLGVGACVALAGCGGRAHRHVEQMAAPTNAASPSAAIMAHADWRTIVTPNDRARLRTWRDAWLAALAKARAAGDAPAIDAQGSLFDPDRALLRATPPPGQYRCRVFKLGANGSAMRDFTAYPASDCRVEEEGDVSSLYKVAGPQRPVGLLFDDGPARAVFLGTMVLGDETKPLDYGQDTSRDMAGFIERVGERRWRLVLPYPRYESILDVVELTPKE